MTNINRGDKVRLTHANGDTAEITVVRAHGSVALDSRSNHFRVSPDDWTVTEVISKGLPTEDGLFLPYQYDDRAVMYPNIFARKDGEWYQIGNLFRDEPIRISEEEVQNWSDSLVRLVVEKEETTMSEFEVGVQP